MALVCCNVGGGLGIDYDGSQTDFESSVNYTLQEYANDVVYHIQNICDEADVPHPTIISESGRAISAYHSVLVFNVLGVSGFGDGEALPDMPDDVEQPLIDLQETLKGLSSKNLLESYHDTQQSLDAALNLAERPDVLRFVDDQRVKRPRRRCFSVSSVLRIRKISGMLLVGRPSPLPPTPRDWITASCPSSSCEKSAVRTSPVTKRAVSDSIPSLRASRTRTVTSCPARRRYHALDVPITPDLAAALLFAIETDLAGAAVVADAGLVEMDMGVLEGLSGPDALQRQPDLFQSFRADPSAVVIPGGETLAAAMESTVEAQVSNYMNATENFVTTYQKTMHQPAFVLPTDEAAGTITITDTGLGMTHGELVENLGTIAHSGTKAFLRQLAEDKKPDVGLIGQFGVGFYSAFMVAKKVTVLSRSFVPEEQGWQWSSEGMGGYDLAPAGDLPRGTKITLELKDDAKEFAQATTTERIIQRYSSFVPFPIELNGKRLNTVQAIWARNKNEIKEEEYNEFYTFVGHDHDKPLFRLHFTADAPLAIQSLLFVPNRNFESMGMGRMDAGGKETNQRERPRLRAGIAVIHDVVHHEAPQPFDVQRILPQHQRRNRAVQRPFRAMHFIYRFA